MITFKLNKKKTKIPVFDELNCEQIYKWNKIVSTGKLRVTDSEVSILRNYLSIVLGKTMMTIDKINVSTKDIHNLLTVIGQPKNYTKLKRAPFYADSRIINVDDLKNITFGQRFIIENNATNLDNEKLMCFELATAIEGGNDLDKINEIFKELMSMNYLLVMPYAFFLDKNLVKSSKRGIIFSIVLSKLAAMILREKEPAYIN